MAKKQTKRKKKGLNHIKLPKCQDGDPCRFILGYQDTPNKYGDLKFRAAFNFISFLVLGFNQTAGNFFFTALLMFAVPMYYDNIKFSPVEDSRKCIKNIMLWVLRVHIFIGFLGLIGILNCVDKSELIIEVSNKMMLFTGASVKLKYLWITVGLEVLLTTADTIVARTTFAKEVYKQQYA